MCSICGNAPAKRGSLHCHQCDKDIKTMKRERRDRAGWWRGAFRYAVWQDYGVAYFQKGRQLTDGIEAKALPRTALARKKNSKGEVIGYRSLPASKLIDLDHYCQGFDRQQVANIKRTIKRLNFIV